MGVLSKQALEGIAAYKYKPGSYTYLDLQLNHFWNAAVEFLPMWMAPNLVTLSGTILAAVTTAVLLYFSPQLEGGAPAWTYLMCGVGLFVYQTLDAIDGKQARRTGSSSPLGQLFDHGCDALSTFLNTLTACVAFRLGSSPHTFIGLASVSITFFFAQWDEYHTGTMSCGNGYYGVTEAQFSLMGVHLFTTLIGEPLWQMQPLPFLPYSFGEIFIGALLASNIILIFTNFHNVLTAAPLAKDDVGHKATSKAQAVLQLIPVAGLALGGYVTMIEGPTRQVYLDYPLLLLTPFGLNYVLLSSRMIVCHMSKVPFPGQWRIVVPLVLFLGVVYAPTLFGIETGISPLVASAVYAVVAVAVYSHYILSVVFEICAHLKINLLTLPKKKD
ncbi:unnamed protein product [Aphanomyces euteiches]|uniref:Aminoalcoholphosphotransferase n=1 Tax=Aphanomyces euteiches TaxID=100861 RepID=A0A6G0WZM9_9STRA|nr:hypothetical protein Ae201684_010080 [Aphanomyces euteiches]KAH9100010.1 hypothetical protein Ae201684P_019015 [Aphanomyces euteiches]KAH9133253.1 hypothetical protein AeRB84_020618 [Aphanomyces euteiches]